MKDAKNLKASDSLDNAGYLIGFAAECAIKYKISTLGGGIDNPKVHFPQLIEAARKRLNSRSEIGMLMILDSKILNGWDVNRRYHASGNTTSEEVDLWIKETTRLMGASGIKERL
ncbi:hypothetical protein [Acerihabitans arboris]|uniref:HEPN domain-containing protein n=1 Tax=Acerihabitans arboris TaxID=2691583 RepID=A0A845SFG7_9GAMM|nr:hypothetical protein [Acerihabitans arboris]